MARRPEPAPVAATEAFARQDRDARLSQAAVLLSIGAVAAGEAECVDRSADIGLPTDIAALGRSEPIPLAEAVAALGIGVGEHVERQADITPTSRSGLAERLVAQPDPVIAATLVEASLHGGTRLVRTAAAVAALNTTGPRDDIVAQLVDAATKGRGTEQEIGRIGLSRVEPSHPALRNAIGRPSPLTGNDRPSHTAFLTHGTWGFGSKWWQPGGDFYDYLNALAPPLHVHDPSFGWTGDYSDGARRLAAQQMSAWVADQNLLQPDVVAHSHGGTVANLATGLGLVIDRLVLLSWPVHREWFPNFANVQRIIDVRLNADLVILADRGGQTFTPPPADAAKVTSHVNGWFIHSTTHEPGYWQQFGLPAAL